MAREYTKIEEKATGQGKACNPEGRLGDNDPETTAASGAGSGGTSDGDSDSVAGHTGSSASWGRRIASFLGATLLALLSSVLVWLCFPFARQSMLVWIALVPFLAVTVGRGRLRGAWLGFVYGFAVHLLLLTWINVFGAFAYVGLSLIKSFFPCILGFLVGGIRLGSDAESNSAGCECNAEGTGWSLPRRLALISCAWIVMEYLQIWGVFGMTVGMLANTQARNPLFLQINSLFGMWGLSWLIVAANVMVLEWGRWLWRRHQARLSGNIWQGAGAGLRLCSWVWLGCFCFTLVFGIVRLNVWGEEAGEPFKIGLVQVAVTQDRKFLPTEAPVLVRRMRRMSRELSARGAQAIFWPETSVPYRGAIAESVIRERLLDISRTLHCPLFVGSIEPAPNDATYNAMSMLDGGKLVSIYNKRHLVPFGEYLPWKEYMPDLPGKEQVMNYLPGDNAEPFAVGPVKIGTLICFESMCTYVPRQHVLNGATMLVVPTNDAWFSRTPEPQMHFDMAIMRAVELGRPVVQIGNTGISGGVSALGRVLSESEENKRCNILETVIPQKGLTLYARFGEYFVWLSFLVCLGACLWPRSRSHVPASATAGD